MPVQKKPDYTDLIVLSPAPHVQQITLDRPKAYNALCTNLLHELADALNKATDDASVRAVVLTGGPAVFAAGADIKEMAAHTATTVKEDNRPGYWATVQNFTKPIIAAVNGFCLGGGNELAMHADIIIAGHNAQFGQPEVNLGIIPGAGGTQRLLRAVGKSRAMQMILADERIMAQEALQYGLVSEVVPAELCVERAVKLATRIASKPPLAVQRAKQSILQAYELPLADGLRFERENFCALFDTEDRLEGIAAFTEKRKPHFKGK